MSTVCPGSAGNWFDETYQSPSRPKEQRLRLSNRRISCALHTTENLH